MAETSALAHSETLPPFAASDPSASAAELRAIMADQGYLFFRRLVPAEDVLAVRRDVLELCAAAGWLDSSGELMDAVVAPDMAPTTEGQAAYMAVYRKVLKLPSFHDFPLHPALMRVAAALLEGQVLVHPRRIGRMAFPNYTVATTPPHQDHYYIRGSVDTYSCWAPLGACPATLGGLAIWPGTHKRGFLDHSVHHPGAVGGCGVPVDPAEAIWHTIDFEPGDALFFHAFTIHKALPNLSGNLLRLSTDNRYQRDGDAIDPGALLPHYNLQ
jgi:ectoine hydroxylase-related dioxygenase (phytanoyl-CoA dioxygenase family)